MVKTRSSRVLQILSITGAFTSYSNSRLLIYARSDSVGWLISYGHAWSPITELAPETPLRQTDDFDGCGIFRCVGFVEEVYRSGGSRARSRAFFPRAGLTVGHSLFDEELLAVGTQATLRARDGRFRAAIPAPLGKCVLLNNVEREATGVTLRMHKEACKGLP
ncbi:hypothetical protein HOY80DRAFT_659475 [Tuber brumale]|nr:hypothetical protein HOY80DRAFT_659475 [Tuber brumale]